MHATKQNGSFPVTMTLLDSEGYVTSRAKPESRNMMAVNSDGRSPVSNRINSMHLDHKRGDSPAMKIVPPCQDEKIALIARLEFFHDELVKCNSESKHWKSEFEKLSHVVKKLTRNQTYEVRSIQRAITTSQQSNKMNKPTEKVLQEYSKLLIERNSLLEEATRHARESVEWKAKFTSLTLEQRKSTMQCHPVSDAASLVPNIKEPKEPEGGMFEANLLMLEEAILNSVNAVMPNRVADEFDDSPATPATPCKKQSSMTVNRLGLHADLSAYEYNEAGTVANVFEPMDILRRDTSQSVQYVQSHGN